MGGLTETKQGRLKIIIGVVAVLGLALWTFGQLADRFSERDADRLEESIRAYAERDPDVLLAELKDAATGARDIQPRIFADDAVGPAREVVSMGAGVGARWEVSRWGRKVGICLQVNAGVKPSPRWRIYRGNCHFG
jgi:hypothetical protein